MTIMLSIEMYTNKDDVIQQWYSTLNLVIVWFYHYSSFNIIK